MEVTIYCENGLVERMVECDKIVPMQNGWVMLIKDPPDCLNGVGLDGTSNILMYTTMPYSLVSHSKRPDHDWKIERSNEEGEQFDVQLRMGPVVKEWKGATCFEFQGKMATFWHNGEWWDVVGQVLIDKIKRKPRW